MGINETRSAKVKAARKAKLIRAARDARSGPEKAIHRVTEYTEKDFENIITVGGGLLDEKREQEFKEARHESAEIFFVAKLLQDGKSRSTMLIEQRSLKAAIAKTQKVWPVGADPNRLLLQLCADEIAQEMGGHSWFPSRDHREVRRHHLYQLAGA